MPHVGHPQLEVRDLFVRYGAGASGAAALDCFSLQMFPGESVGIAGPSGSGKSTLARAILGMLPPGSWSKGQILFRNRNLPSLRPAELAAIRGKEMTLVHQEPALALNPVMRVGNQIDEVLRAHTALPGSRRADRVRELLSWVKLDNARYLRAYPHELSGGERHRVVIAQALACDPALVIADEPTAGLDAIVQAEILELFLRLREQRGFSLLLISHDTHVLARLTGRVVHLSKTAGTGTPIAQRKPAIPAAASAKVTPIVALRGLKKSYAHWRWLARRDSLVEALAGVDLTLEAGTTTALVGASGSGKSTLARCLAMLDGADGGEIRFRGTDVLRASRAELRKLRPQIQLVFQESAASLNTNFSVAEAIEEPLLIRGMALSERRARVAALMGEVGLAAGSAEKPVLEFSGGERQRIAIARALATEPAVMIFDESTSGLDDETEAQILELLARIQAERGLTYLVISHDLRTVAQIAGSVAVMHRGQIVEHAATGKVLSQPQHPYSQSLVAAHRQSEELARAAGQ